MRKNYKKIFLLIKIKKESKSFKKEMRSLFAELFGTFALTFTSIGIALVSIISHEQVDYVARVAAPGLMVMAMIYTFGNVSGTHINPAVSFSFALRGDF